MNRVYLVDAENVGKCYLKRMNVIDKDDIVIHLDNNSSLNINLKLNLKELVAVSDGISRLKIIETVNGKPNSLDFVLSTLIGHLITIDPYKEYIIVSNDSGFDSVVNFWCKRAIKIERHDDIGLALKNTYKNIRKNKVDLIFKRNDTIKSGIENAEKIKELIKLRKNESVIELATILTEYTDFDTAKDEITKVLKYDKQSKLKVIQENLKEFKH